MPNAAVWQGASVVVKVVASGANLTVLAQGGTVEGAASFIIRIQSQLCSYTFQSDGVSNWDLTQKIAPVKSGTQNYSVIVGGESGNTATNVSSVVVGGFNNTSSGSSSGTLCSQGSTASGTRSVTLGGNACTASGTDGVCIGGSGTLASASNTLATGGGHATAQDALAIGRGTVASALFSLAIGRDAQATVQSQTAIGVGTDQYGDPNARNWLVQSGESVGGASGDMDFDFAVNGKTYALCITVLGSRQDAQGCNVRTFTGLIHGSGGSLVVDNTTPVTTVTNGQTWTASFSAPGGLTFRVTVAGTAGQTVGFKTIVEWMVLNGA